MKTIVVYDNNVQKNDTITDIIGDKGFGDVVVKKKKIEDYVYNKLKCEGGGAIWKNIKSKFEYFDLIEYIKRIESDNIRVFHYLANYYIVDFKKFNLSYKKLLYIEDTYKVLFDNDVIGIMFNNAQSYIQFLKNVVSEQSFLNVASNIKNAFEAEGLVDISKTNNFIRLITGNFDSRYFNSLKEDKYTITKTSFDKLKIKKEYTYYNLLPEDMKFWFVMPFSYKEEKEEASYTMERLYMTDLAIKWVHGSITLDEFSNLTDKYFFFFKSRHKKPCSSDEYNKISKELYETKVIKRIDELKTNEKYPKIKAVLLSSGIDIDELVKKYFSLKEKIETKINYPKISVIGHGDPGFANALYNKQVQMLKFIDPKGALCEDEMWTNPYYDIAKLSHCICGRYDFFNNGLFDIKLNNNFKLNLEINFDNKKYIDIFKQKLNENGFDYFTTRIYEASLFLSMLPLHIDNEYKVLGFILNAQNIMGELERDV